MASQKQFPTEYLYVKRVDANGTVTTGDQTCIIPDILNVTGHAFLDKFSPLESKKMVVSAWVMKKVSGDCLQTSYDGNSIEVSYILNNNTVFSESPFYPEGSIIDGWQRYEAFFDIPSDAKLLNIKLHNSVSNTAPVYWDDLRVHPFNANMKSFVYNRFSLRLMAELDENNYATFYEYDDEGTLVRVKKETEDGVKTLKETRSSLQKVNPN